MASLGNLNELDEEDTEVTHKEYKRDALLYVIEVSKSMLEKDAEGYSSLSRALRSAYETMKLRSTGSYLDYTGVLLYGTEKYNKQRYASCHVIVDLHQPRIADLRLLKDLLEDEQLFESTLTPSTENPPSIGNVMEYAATLFNDNTTANTYKRMLWITDNENPHRDDKNEVQLAKTRSQDLVDYEIQLEPTFVATEGHFDLAKFWGNLNYGPYSGVSNDISSTVVTSSQLIRSIERKRTVLRSGYRVIIELGDKIKIGAKGYLVVKKAKLPTVQKVYANEERKVFAQSKTSYQVGATAKEIESKDVVKAFPILDDYVLFTPEELTDLKTFEPAPVIRILGFKPISAVEPWQNITHPFFFYPTDEKFENSKRAFACLHQVMLETKQVAIAWSLMQRNSTPRITALFAIQAADTELAKNDLDIRQCGFQLVVLPFADEVRQEPPELSLGTPPDVPEAAIEKAREIHNALLLEGGYIPSRYHNFLLQSFHSHLEAYALGEEEAKIPEDVKIPVDKIDKVSGDLIKEFHNIFSPV